MPQALEKDCKMTYTSGGGRVFGMWAIPGHPIHCHRHHTVLLHAMLKQQESICWVTSCTHTELCLIITCLFDTGRTVPQRRGKLYWSRKRVEKRQSCALGSEAGREWLRDQVCLPVVKGANYSPFDSVLFWSVFFYLKSDKRSVFIGWWYYNQWCFGF